MIVPPRPHVWLRDAAGYDVIALFIILLIGSQIPIAKPARSAGEVEALWIQDGGKL